MPDNGVNGEESASVYESSAPDWARLQINHELKVTASAAALVKAFAEAYANGRSEFASFLLSPSPYVSRLATPQRLNQQDIWTALLPRPAVLVAMQKPEATPDYLERATFAILRPGNLEDDITDALTAGGAYRSLTKTKDIARSLVETFCADPLGESWTDVTIMKARTVWSDWFMLAPWDLTWLGLDRATGRFWALRATDID